MEKNTEVNNEEPVKDQKLSETYNVWVMCKNYSDPNAENKEANAGNNMDKMYQQENKVVASFDSVGTFW